MLACLLSLIHDSTREILRPISLSKRNEPKNINIKRFKMQGQWYHDIFLLYVLRFKWLYINILSESRNLNFSFAKAYHLNQKLKTNSLVICIHEKYVMKINESATISSHVLAYLAKKNCNCKPATIIGIRLQI